MNKKNEYLMAKAIEISEKMMQRGIGGPFGAVISKDNKIISRGWNKVTSANDPTAHAEISAIRKACKKLKTFDLSGCEIYTSCEPCPMCLSAIYWAHLDKIYFANTQKDASKIGFDDRYLYDQIKKTIKFRDIKMIKIVNKKALEIFRQWENKENKIIY